ncbi:tRNA lysidine(34) synthetase TilS [Mesorhizobium sp. LHD-90]|uniref:tRNA lysidine(34) synthetase TilS n=1 Tax=Mesorhizobium sp. LHD-90 TaxID=3071414 RepID=UPI0027E0571B|nr:tRNA lysidine(34) synthetase TilS [Mesorhizobium sp. LHD-90]MDQ6437018.1 tRNA lysidine(34) synthetase TilS [Mesorhizobium sp. LHD-90]
MQTALSPPGELLAPFSAFAFERRTAVVAAVSGGSDSTALLLLLKRHIDRFARPVRLIAVTVDHGLRPEAAGEARAVGRLAAKLGVEHRILRWTGPKPETGVSAAAREARYRLLAQAAEEAGTDIVVTAHTADDQAETVSMRRRRGDGMGLAGMAPATLFDGKVWIARPLLETRRETLRDFLTASAVGWFDDPSNVDPRSERARVRAELSSGERADDAFRDLLELAKRSAGQRIDVGRRAASLVTALAREVEPGLILLDRSLLTAEDGVAAAFALRVLLAVSGGAALLPDEQRTQSLLEKLGKPPCRATLSRALIASRRDGIWVAREQRSLPTPQAVYDGMIWDGRFRLSGPRSGSATIAAVGAGNARRTAAGDGLPGQLARAARAAQPAQEGTDGWQAAPVAGPYARFLSAFDLDMARAVSSLVGGSAIPDPPCAGHNVGRA